MYLVTESFANTIYRDARKDGPLIYHTGNLGLFIYCCVKKNGAIRILLLEN